MKIRLAESNDCKAIWMWMQDDLLKSIGPTWNHPKYEAHVRWFKRVTESENLVIGVVESLRIGFAFGELTPVGNYEVCFFLKPRYCALYSDIFIARIFQFVDDSKGLECCFRRRGKSGSERIPFTALGMKGGSYLLEKENENSNSRSDKSK